MSRKKSEMNFLYCLLIISIGISPIVMKRQSRKEWIFVFLFNAITNVILDKITIKKKLIMYPTRLLPRIFNIHILYDVVLYPIVTVIYNQMTYKDKLSAIVYKVLFFSAPLTLFEIWAERNTGLIKWRKGWKWYHTLLSVSLKSLITRSAVEILRQLRKSDSYENLHVQVLPQKPLHR